MHSPLFRVSDDGRVELEVHAQPGAGRTQITGRYGDALKIRVAVPPEHGRANSALVTLLADQFGVAAKDVELVSGEKSRSKRFRFAVEDLDAFERRLDELVAAGGGTGGPSTGRERDRGRRPR